MLQRALAFALIFAALFLFAQNVDARPARHAAMILDANTGAVLHNDDGDAIRHPASLTKMMTLYLTFETIESGRLKMSDKIPISEAAAGVAPSKLDLDPGEEISVSDAIKALITKSANDVAVAIAEKIGGTQANFIHLMNARARDLGMSKTHFENPSGLPNPDHVSTARDMITLALHLQDDYPAYYALFATRAFSYRGKTYRNHNTMLNSFAGIDGIKTGYTRASGFNIVTSLRRGRQHLIGAVFGGQSAASRNGEMRTLLTRMLSRASTKVTRKPRPLLAAKLKSEPKAATPAASRRSNETIVADAGSAAPRPFAAAKARPAPAPETDPAAAALRAMAQAAPPAAAAAEEPPVKIFKVRHVPVLAKAPAAAPSPDETTDMEGIDGPATPSTDEETAPAAPAAAATVAAMDTAEAPALAGKLAQSFAELRARGGDEAPTVAANDKRPSPLDDIAMLGARDAIPSQPAARPTAPTTNAPLASATAPAEASGSAVAPPPALTPPVRTAKAAAPAIEPRPAPQRGLPPSTLTAQAHALKASSKTAHAQPNQAVSVRATAGHYEVQIGAFGSIAEARHALSAVQTRAGALLAGVSSVTQPTMKDGRQIFRARFAGFNADRAASTCTELRRQSVDCFVMAAGN